MYLHAYVYVSAGGDLILRIPRIERRRRLGSGVVWVRSPTGHATLANHTGALTHVAGSQSSQNDVTALRNGRK